MKITAAFLFSSIAIARLAAAQTATPTKPHTATHTAAVASACMKLPPLSPKIPALPAGTPCAKPIYTLTTVPRGTVSEASPAVAPAIREYFGIEPVNVTLGYIDTKIGTGELAAQHKWYSVLYTGYLQDGTVFDASSKQPNNAPFVLQQGIHMVIPGWDTGFYGMHVGGKRRLFIPRELAYGTQGKGAVPPNADLIFDIELVAQSDTNPTPPPARSAPPAPAPAPAPTPTAPAPPPSAATAPKP